jgi:hypothetical protein
LVVVGIGSGGGFIVIVIINFVLCFYAISSCCIAAGAIIPLYVFVDLTFSIITS